MLAVNTTMSYHWDTWKGERQSDSVGGVESGDEARHSPHPRTGRRAAACRRKTARCGSRWAPWRWSRAACPVWRCSLAASHGASGSASRPGRAPASSSAQGPGDAAISARAGTFCTSPAGTGQTERIRWGCPGGGGGGEWRRHSIHIEMYIMEVTSQLLSSELWIERWFWWVSFQGWMQQSEVLSQVFLARIQRGNWCVQQHHHHHRRYSSAVYVCMYKVWAEEKSESSCETHRRAGQRQLSTHTDGAPRYTRRTIAEPWVSVSHLPLWPDDSACSRWRSIV